MGLRSCKPCHARLRAPSPVRDHRGPPRKAPASRLAGRGLSLLLVALAAFPAWGEPLRIATWAAPLSREGPGLLLRDLLKEEAEGTRAVVEVLLAARPDVLLLTDIDWDAQGAALGALAGRLGEEGLEYPHRLTLAPNAGLPTGLDMDGNGVTGEPRDAQGYGRFRGDGGMAILSRWPLGEARDLSSLLWRDLPDARLPEVDGQPFPSAAAQAIQRLSSTGHWIVPVEAPGGAVTLLAWAATPPVFDGPEDLNGRRNADELALWAQVLDGTFGPPPQDFILLGNAELDPMDGEGWRGDMAALLADPRLRDPRPGSEGGRLADGPGQHGDPAFDTVDWPEDGAGNLRVSYVLPAATLPVVDAGVLWPAPDDPLAQAAASVGPHRLVWVDIAR